MISTSKTLAAALVAVASLGLVACSGDEEPTSEKTPAPAEAAPTLAGAAMATQDLKVTTCPPGTGSVTATGEVVNRAKKKAAYVVTVNWLAKDGSVLTSAWTQVEARGNKGRADWEVSADLGDEQAASCTTRLTKGRA